MTDRSIKKRITDLENQNPERPFIAIYQSWDDPDEWHPGSREADPITYDQIGKQYSGYTVFEVWCDRGRPDNDQ